MSEEGMSETERAVGTTTELLPERSSFRPDEDVRVELRTAPGAAGGRLTLWHLGEAAGSWEDIGCGRHSLGALAPGGYGVEWTDGTSVVRTAVEVTGDTRARLRYGFAVDYGPGRDPHGLSDTVRRLHLTDVQFYDWAYRHAELLGGGRGVRRRTRPAGRAGHRTTARLRGPRRRCPRPRLRRGVRRRPP